MVPDIINGIKCLYILSGIDTHANIILKLDVHAKTPARTYTALFDEYRHFKVPIDRLLISTAALLDAKIMCI